MGFSTQHTSRIRGRSKQCVRIHEKNITQRISGPAIKLSPKHIGFPTQKKNAIFRSRPLHSRGFFVIKKIIKKLNKFNSFKEINIYSIIYVYKNIWTYKIEDQTIYIVRRTWICQKAITIIRQLSKNRKNALN
jgi:hypothetical protein